MTTLLNNQKVCPTKWISEFCKILTEHCTSLNNINPTASTSIPIHSSATDQSHFGICLCNKQILLEVILLPSVNHTVKLHNLVRSLPFCNVTQCWLLVTDVLGQTVHPETSVTNYQSMLPNIPEEWRSHYTMAEGDIWRPVKYFLLIHRQGI
jgi:hypothetical protein